MSKIEFVADCRRGSAFTTHHEEVAMYSPTSSPFSLHITLWGVALIVGVLALLYYWTERWKKTISPLEQKLLEVFPKDRWVSPLEVSELFQGKEDKDRLWDAVLIALETKEIMQSRFRAHVPGEVSVSRNGRPVLEYALIPNVQIPYTLSA